MPKTRSYRRVPLLAALGVAAAVIILSPGVAEAQVSVVRPPKVNEPSQGQTWLYYLIGFALGGAALGLTLMPSRRTHQD